jgi:predicted CopG family antitoxin
MDNITSIQIRENVKDALDRMKTNKESYEEVILNLMKTSEQCKRSQKELLIEGYKEMAEESLKITKEWEAVDAELDWECEGLIPEKYLKKRK